MKAPNLEETGNAVSKHLKYRNPCMHALVKAALCGFQYRRMWYGIWVTMKGRQLEQQKTM